MTIRRSAALVSALLLCAGSALAQDATTPEERAKLAESCVGTIAGVTMETVDFTTVDGSTVRACLAYPAGSTPDTLVTFTHGIGHYVQASWAPHIERIAAANDVIALATNYRDNFGFPSLRGAEDAIVVTKLVAQRFPSVTTNVLFSVSMGTSVGGTALAESPRLNGGEPLWTHWVVAEGVTNLFESYAEAALVAEAGNATAQRARDGMERDTGGTPDSVPDAYALRSPLLRATEIAPMLEAAAFIHSVADGLVGFHQGASMASALCAEGVPTAFDVITTGSGSRDDSTLFDLIGVEDANESTVDLSGHGSEADETHPVMAQSFARLDQLLSGGVYDNGCATAFGAEAVTRSPAQTPTTTTTTTPGGTGVLDATAGPDASTAPALPATGGTDRRAPALALVALAVAVLLVHRRVSPA